MSTDYRLRVIRMEGLNWEHPLHSKVPNLFVEVKLGDVKKKTRTVFKNSLPTWNVSIPLSSSDDSAILEIQVKHESTWIRDPCVGLTCITITDLLRKCANGEASLYLIPTGKSSMASAGQIVLDLEVMDKMTSAGTSLAAASEDVRQREILRSIKASEVTQSIRNQASQQDRHGDLYRAVGQLVSKLDAFRQFMDVLSEMHPFLSIAWKIASGLYSAVEKVYKTDNRVIDLVQSMDDAFAFVCGVETLPDKSTSLQQAIMGLLKQTIECCFFVSCYTGRGFLGRMLDVSSGQKIGEFECALAGFKQQIESGVILHTAIVSTRVPQEIDDLLLQQRLSPDRYDAFDRTLCLPGTRVEIRKEIIEWVFSDSKQNIFWLHGLAGSGKSTVSATIAKHFRDMSRLGAFLFFQRGKSDPSSVIRTIAYKLALFDSTIGSSVLSEIKADKDIGSASSEDQFRKLLLQPLLAAAPAMSGPVIVVLDALDECGVADSRRNLMELFRKEFPKLPNIFRFLITGRRETDINNVLFKRPESVRFMELDYSSAAGQQDVLSYLRAEMHKIVRSQVEIPDDCPWSENITQLGKAAGGLFIWASTAVKLVRSSDDPFYHLDRLVTDSRSLSGFGLDKLYATILRCSGILWDSDRSKERFKKVMALLILSKVPISSKTIDGILGFRPHENCILILSRLQSLISFATDGPINLFHASFSDFLTSPKHSSEPWFIDVRDANRLILGRCFSVMENMLHFNMCNLETSFVRNDDVPGFADRVKVCIPSHLEYVCIHWVQHLRDAPYFLEVLKSLTDFAHQRLLFWFEVLSLVKSFGRIASRALIDAAEWIKSDGIADLTVFLRDASDLATIFAFPIADCTPHIYLTMIPLSKDESVVSTHSSKQMSSITQMQRTGSKRSLNFMRVLEGYVDPVRSVVSSDGKLIASAPRDYTISIWDLHIRGEILSLDDDINSVGFFSDGRHLASFSLGGTSRIWNVQTGNLVLRYPLGLAGIQSVAVAPNGTKAASGDAFGTIVVCHVSIGTEFARFIEHTDWVLSFVFSPDGKHLASGSFDGTTRIWDVDGRTPAFGPFTGHDEWTRLFPFSQDGKYIMSCSRKVGVRIRELESGSIVSVFNKFDGL